MKIVGVNGIHNFSWSKTSFVDSMLDALADEFEVADVHYPLMLAVLAYFDAPTDRVARAILGTHAAGDVLIAHSFGCFASVRAMKLGAKFSTVFFFGAAAECNVDLPVGAFERLYNVHSETDRALKIGVKIPGHGFGGLGLTGYAGSDPRVINIPAHGHGHNDYVHPRNLCRWSGWIKTVLRGPSDLRKVG